MTLPRGAAGDAPGDLSDAEVARRVVVAGVSAAFAEWLAARSAGGSVAARTKSNSTDVVTAADEAAEAAMVTLLQTLRPADAVIGEEGAVLTGSSGRTWVLDPLDGTYNFTRDSERWCSAAALVVDDVPVLGAVSGGGAARVWIGGAAVAPTESAEVMAPLFDAPLGQACLLTYLHPPHHATAVGEAWRRLVGACATWRSTGSGSLDATDVAAGRAELLVQHSVPLWDSAPGEAIVLALGGVSRRVQADGVEWFLLGAPSAVAEAEELLRGR